MSYVERALYSYLYSTLSKGVRILLSRRFFLFSIIMVGIGLASSILALATLIPDLNFLIPYVPIFLGIELGVAAGFIISGIIGLWVRPTVIRIVIMALSIIPFPIIAWIAYPPGGTVNTLIGSFLLEILPLVAFVIWTIFIPIFTYTFLRGLFTHRIFGTLLFLGKPETDKKSVFSGPIVIVIFIELAMSLVFFTRVPFDIWWALLGVICIIMSIVGILVALGLLSRDDVFNSQIGFFYIFIAPNFIMLVFGFLNENLAAASAISFLYLLFSLLYGSQSVSKKIITKMDMLEDEEVVEEDEEGGIPKPLRRDGFVLVFLGLALGYHLAQLVAALSLTTSFQLLFPFSNNLFSYAPISEYYHIIDQVWAYLIVITMVGLFILLPRWREIVSPDRIHRFSWLPEYTDAVSFIKKARTSWDEGEWKGLLAKTTLRAAKDVARISTRKAGSTAKETVSRTARAGREKSAGLLGRLRRDNEE